MVLNFGRPFVLQDETSVVGYAKKCKAEISDVGNSAYCKARMIYTSSCRLGDFDFGHTGTLRLVTPGRSGSRSTGSYTSWHVVQKEMHQYMSGVVFSRVPCVVLVLDSPQKSKLKAKPRS